ncbi:MAG TPA: 23S rRNA (pseudouridine(1915)-N(3))-methyltransferase RlmH [Erysipelotrichaceae bacterium]|nr:23S rRNA (pseudouridine(1915)-N(3))-methyltransferase RlmH [Erysipelotrichaceae bacterium]
MIKIVCVGKLKEKAIISLVDDYLKRILPYSKISIDELKDYPNYDDEASNKLSIEKESKSILDKITNDDFVILLDLRGKYYTSVEISQIIDQASVYGSKNIVFVIGGSLGVDETVVQRANSVWKLSNNTFPHGLVRVLVLEQIYRSYRILNNQAYHK